jgi:hypothetical protein
MMLTPLTVKHWLAAAGTPRGARGRVVSSLAGTNEGQQTLCHCNGRGEAAERVSAGQSRERISNICMHDLHLMRGQVAARVALV